MDDKHMMLTALATIAGISLLSCLAWLYNELVLKAWRNVRSLRAQGIRGPSFRPIVGNLPELRAV